MIQIQHIMSIGTMIINKKGDSMKKYFVFVLLFIFCFLSVSCSNDLNKDNDNDNVFVIASDNSESFFYPTKQNSQKPVTQTVISSEYGGAELLPRKYRNNYYSIPASFVSIVGKKSFEEWEDVYLAENYPDDSNEMVMLAYVKEFNISKEDFEKANLKYAHFIDKTYSHICLDPKDYADQEFQEIYNTEIIYTFDNNLINEYYLGIDYPFLNEYEYIEAMEAGTYKTRTTEFIDIEQMEADIIAKYGEAESVTEATEITIPEEITATDLSQIETTE